jgi:hypothetical protein
MNSKIIYASAMLSLTPSMINAAPIVTGLATASAVDATGKTIGHLSPTVLHDESFVLIKIANAAATDFFMILVAPGGFPDRGAINYTTTNCTGTPYAATLAPTGFYSQPTVMNGVLFKQNYNALPGTLLIKSSKMAGTSGPAKCYSYPAGSSMSVQPIQYTADLYLTFTKPFKIIGQ